jgi:hypothetical protein
MAPELGHDRIVVSPARATVPQSLIDARRYLQPKPIGAIFFGKR